MRNKLLDAESHFAFGENWANYSKSIGDGQIAEAITGLRRLLGDFDLRGRRFLDVGSGSGLHALAALRLGAAEVVAVDIDPESVKTTRAVLAKFAPDGRYRVEHRSVFDLAELALGKFDVVYSWGVLHHTGDLTTALRRAAQMVTDGGMFTFALYHRTWLCPLWTLEKKWYSSASERAQRWARNLFSVWMRVIMSVVRARDSLVGRPRLSAGREAPVSFDRYVASYVALRGMDFEHDVHDWLGGYPYQSTLPDEVDELMIDCGLQHKTTHLWRSRGRTHGLLGSSCDEYVYVR